MQALLEASKEVGLEVYVNNTLTEGRIKAFYKGRKYVI
jgi:hypothetical protein